MINLLYSVFIICISAITYTYLIYPIVLMLLPAKSYKSDLDTRPLVSVIVAAYNEEKVIAEKINNLIGLNYPSDKIEYLIGSDGSSDRTIQIANNYSRIKNLRTFDLPRGGKVSVLNRLISEARGEVLVFSDANTMYTSDSILHLVKHYVDERIGCVSGQMRYKIGSNAGSGARLESIYWKYENWVKVQESKIGRLSGANGAIYSIRRGLISQIIPGIINDDFYVSTFILQAGYDVIIDTEAVAYEEPNEDFMSQFKRHIRDGAGHYQAICVFKKMLLPRKGSYAYISHRVIKWLIPFLLTFLYISSMILMNYNIFTLVLLVGQTLVYASSFIYYVITAKNNVKKNGSLGKILSLIFYFTAINFSLLLGWVRFVSKRQKATWETQR